MAQAVNLGESQSKASGSQQPGTTPTLDWRWLLAIGAAALAWKVILLAMVEVPFNADEAIVGLMARHILDGERPIFFYGQAYLGSLDAYLISFTMALVGRTVAAIRWTQVLIYVGTVVTTGLLAARAFRSRFAGATAALLMAVPTVNVTLYTTVSIGGYGEALLIGNLLLLCLAAAGSQARPPAWLFPAWGLLAGLGFWGFGLTLIYSVPTGIGLAVLYWRHRRRGPHWPILATAATLVIGASPWILWAGQHGLGDLIAELFGSAIAGASPGSAAAAWGQHLANLTLFGPTVIMGLRPPWSVQLLAWPISPIPIVFWLSVLGFGVWHLRRAQAVSPLTAALLAVVGLDLLGFVLTPFGADPSGRYFLPLMVPMAVFGGGALAWLGRSRRTLLAYAAVAALMTYNLAATVDAAVGSATGLTTQFDPVAQVDQGSLPDLIDFLRSHDLDRGYTNYWVAYPLAFASDEELIFVPALPYHLDLRYTARDNRYPPYEQLVASSSHIGYITTHHPVLNAAIEAGLDSLSVGHQQAEIGPYTVFYDLSRPVRPEELELGLRRGDS